MYYNISIGWDVRRCMLKREVYWWNLCEPVPLRNTLDLEEETGCRAVSLIVCIIIEVGVQKNTLVQKTCKRLFCAMQGTVGVLDIILF